MSEYRCPCGWGATARHPEGILAAAKDHQERGCEKGDREVTDNRTNEPTEAQIEAAAEALRADEGFMGVLHSSHKVSWSEYIARLVLIAAAVAPQPREVDPRHTADHSKFDQGGYCNELVVGSDGTADICNYRTPDPNAKDHLQEAKDHLLNGRTESVAKAQAHATVAIAEWLRGWPIAHDESPVISVNGVS